MNNPGLSLLLIVFLVILFVGCVNQPSTTVPASTTTATAIPTTVPTPQPTCPTCNQTVMTSTAPPVVTQAAGAPTGQSQVPNADFTANQTSGRVPFPVQFSDSSTLAPTNWSWDFGDGSSSNETNPVHTYLTSGRYTVKLTASNAAGSNTVTRTYYIAVTPEFQSPAAGFGINPQEALSNTIQFMDQSNGPAANWSWNFGDGGTSDTKDPVHSFSSPGNYMVTLTVSNPLGSSTVTKELLLGGAPGAAGGQSSSAGTSGTTYPNGLLLYQQNW